MPRNAKAKRSQDQARLADEKARGVGPQAKAGRPGRPRKYAGASPQEREAERSRSRRAAARAAKAAAEALDAPTPPEPDGLGKIEDEIPGQHPPLHEPPLVDDGPLTSDGLPVSPLWQLVRDRYEGKTRALVDALVSRQKLELDDLVWLELAEQTELSARRDKRDIASVMLQSRKQLARLLVARGPIGGVNDVPVRVPEGMSLEELTVPLSDGDDVLAEPRDAEFPERYR